MAVGGEKKSGLTRLPTACQARRTAAETTAVVTATATLCGSLLFVLAMLAFSYFASQSKHEELLKKAHQVTPETSPNLGALARDCVERLRPGRVNFFVVPGNVLNAYTFGLSDPKVVVFYSPMLQVMDADELKFVTGHELGHVRLGHTWLNSLVGGMAGIPSPLFAAVILQIAFRWWNRMCEYSADRAGLLACGKPNKAISALVKLATGGAAQTSADLQKALALIEKEDDDLANNIGELLGTHPMIVKRIEELRRYIASDGYRRLQALVNKNVEYVS